MAEVVKDIRVSLKGRACAAGCLKLYMARTPQELIAAGVVPEPPAVAGAVSGSAPGPQPSASGQGPEQWPVASSSAPGSAQPASGTVGAFPGPGVSSKGLSATSPAPTAQTKPKLPISKAGVKKGVPTEGVSFALGWFADSGEDDGEERLWLEEQMMVADGVKEKVCVNVSALYHLMHMHC